MIEELLTAREVCEITKWKRDSLYQKKWRGEIEYVKIGRSLRFKKSSILALIEQGTTPARRSA
jgi:excisionase family DNA binding protein